MAGVAGVKRPAAASELLSNRPQSSQRASYSSPRRAQAVAFILRGHITQWRRAPESRLGFQGIALAGRMAAFANCFYGALQALAMRAAKLLSICRNAATGWVRTLLIAHDLSFASCHRGTREIGCGFGVGGDQSCRIFCEDHHADLF
jgi:hypothetical protein